jgi:hypothetical protein
VSTRGPLRQMNRAKSCETALPETGHLANPTGRWAGLSRVRPSLREALSEELFRGYRTSAGKHEAPQNWPNGSGKSRQAVRRRAATIFHPPVKFIERFAKSDVEKPNADRSKNPCKPLCMAMLPTPENTEIYPSTDPPPPADNRREQDAVSQKIIAEINQTENRD